MILAIEVMAMQHTRLGWLDPEIARGHHRTLLAEAEIDRTIQRLRGDAARRRGIRSRLGDLFIALGCRLKRTPVYGTRPLTGADGPWPATGDGGS